MMSQKIMINLILIIIQFLFVTFAQASERFELLKSLVEINTASDNINGLNQARSILIPEMEKLGLKTTTFQLGFGHQILQFELPDATPTVILLGHLDTVFKADSSFQKLKIVNGSYVGPGVIDMKGGIVLMIEIMKNLIQSNQAKNIRIVINDDEELGSPYSRKKLQEITQDISNILVYEPGLPDGSVVISESGVTWLSLAVQGKAAHAGLEPELGINACVELSNKIASISHLSNYSRNLSVNAGTIEGGTKTNIVCESARTTIDIRYKSSSDLTDTLERIEEIRSKMTTYNPILNKSPTATLSQIVSLPPLLEKSTKYLFEQWLNSGISLNTPVSGKHVGYASDANHLDNSQHQILVGLGPFGGGMHTENEFMKIESFDQRLSLNLELIKRITK